MMDALIVAVASFIIVIAGTGGYLLSRLKKLEARDEARRSADIQVATDRADKLQARVDELESKAARVDDLERQLSVLTKTVESLQTRVETAENLAADKQTEIDKLTTEKTQLEKQNGDLFEANKNLTLERKTYREALALLGAKFADYEAQESAEKQPKTEPEAAAVAETSVAVPETKEGI